MDFISGSNVTMDQYGLNERGQSASSSPSAEDTSPREASSPSPVGILKMIFILLLMPISSIMGNLISIGPGTYPSNSTLGEDHSGILVLGSCEFMHNGQLISINVYVATADWLVLQIWRPVDDVIGKMALVHSRMLQPNQTDTIVQVWYQNDSVHVKAGDKIGLMKINSTLPVPYIANPRMTANIWHSSHRGEGLDSGQVLTFDEYGFPYHFSLTVTFRADRPNIYDILQRINKTEKIMRSGDKSNNNVTTDYDKKFDFEDKMNNLSKDITTHKHVRYRYDNIPNLELLRYTQDGEDYPDNMDVSYVSKITDSTSAILSEPKYSKSKPTNETSPADHMTTTDIPIVLSPLAPPTQTTQTTTMHDIVMQDEIEAQYVLNNTLHNITMEEDGEQWSLLPGESGSEANASASVVTNGNVSYVETTTKDRMNEFLPSVNTEAATTHKQTSSSSTRENPSRSTLKNIRPEVLPATESQSDTLLTPQDDVSAQYDVTTQSDTTQSSTRNPFYPSKSQSSPRPTKRVKQNIPHNKKTKINSLSVH